jgi:addiction module HigA family antidote
MMAEQHTEHPGVVLQRRFLEPLGISPSELSRSLGVSTRTVAGLLAGRRGLSVDLALRLSLYFDVPARWWLEMQARYEADDPAALAELRTVVTPYAGLDRVLVTPTGVIPIESAPILARPSGARFSAELEARLRAQARLADRTLEREPVVVYHEDGTPTLTGR